MPRTATRSAPAPKAAVYTRISSDRDGTPRLGVKRQEKACRALCAARGWDPVVFPDNDVSAADPKVVRPQYQAMLDGISAGEFVAVVTWDLDRLHRQPIELETFVRVCDTAGLTEVLTVGEQLDLSGEDGLLVARIKSAVAAKEISSLKKRLASKRDELATGGKYSGGQWPFGRGPDMVIREDEAAIIREAAERVLAGESFRGMALDLSNRGLGPRSGGRWPGGSNLAARITRPHVAGLRVHRGTVVGDGRHKDGTRWEPILDRETWERLVALRADPSRRTRTGPPARMLLTGGVARCGKCGRNLRARVSVKGVRRYGCPPEGDHGYGCGGVTRVADEIDKYVTEAVLARLEASDLGPLVSSDTDLAALSDELAVVDAKLAALAAAWAADDLTTSEWNAARRGLSTRQEALQRRMSTARRSSAAAAIAGPTARSAWSEKTMDEQRTIIEEMLPGGVTLASLGRGGWHRPFDPATVDLGWFDRDQPTMERRGNTR